MVAESAGVKRAPMLHVDPSEKRTRATRERRGRTAKIQNKYTQVQVKRLHTKLKTKNKGPMVPKPPDPPQAQAKNLNFEAPSTHAASTSLT